MAQGTDKDDKKPSGDKSKTLVLIIVNLIVVVLGITLIIDGLSP
ncbi:MAG TPA: hypothetical protein VM325_00545 [Alphaproteobacteria bacterium]|nr:hypothetical protein [Alphaproteobacteria bacterium]